MSLPDTTRATELKADNTLVRKLLVEQVFEDDVIKDVLRRSGDRTCAHAASGEYEQEGLSKRPALTVMQTIDSAPRSQLSPTRMAGCASDRRFDPPAQTL